MSPKNTAAKAEAVSQNEIDQLHAAAQEGAVDEDGKVKLELVVTDDGEEMGTPTQPFVQEPVQQPVSSVQTAKFAQLNESPVAVDQSSMDLLLDVDLDLSVELGRASVPVREILQLGSGSIVELNKLAGDSIDVLVNGRLIARGEVVVVDENFGVRITEILSPTDRISRLG